MTGRAAVAVLGALLLLAAASPALDESVEKPFPVAKSTILREGRVVYVVEGTLTIPAGVEVSCQKDVHIRGKGRNPVIRVEGALKVHGVGLREVIFEGVTVELAPEFGDVHLDAVIFRDGGGIRSGADRPSSGKLFVEGVSFEGGAGIDLKFEKGSIDFSSVTSSGATSVVVVKDEEGNLSKLRLNIRGSDLSDLTVRNGHDVTVRLTRLAGGAAVFHDCHSLVFDGNKVNAERLAITHSVSGGLKSTKITKCDIYSSEVSVRAPKKGGRSGDKVVMDRCWFKDVVDTAALTSGILKDAEDDPENGARLVLGKVSARPNELAGAVDR